MINNQLLSRLEFDEEDDGEEGEEAGGGADDVEVDDDEGVRLERLADEQREEDGERGGGDHVDGAHRVRHRSDLVCKIRMSNLLIF